MSKHTDLTNQMTNRIKQDLDSYRRNYNVTLLISPPKNKEAAILEEVKWKMNSAKNWAAIRGYTVEYNIVATPKEPLKFNCKGCRTRKTGDYFWVQAKLVSKDPHSYGGWTNNMAKVCSKECGELMILRLA